MTAQLETNNLDSDDGGTGSDRSSSNGKTLQMVLGGEKPDYLR